MLLIILFILCLTRLCFSEGQNCNIYMKDCIICNASATVCSQCNDTFTPCKLKLDHQPDWTSCCSGKCKEAHLIGQVKHCVVCIDSFYGDNCEKSCKPNCKTCNKTTGKCAECADGFYGDSCCSSLCNGTCDTENGHCSNCRYGWHGFYCNTYCSGNCLECNENTRTCEVCHSGYFGHNCSRCPANCNSTICDQTDGNCTNGCKEGFYGPKCTYGCSTGCKNRGNKCNQHSGKCTSGCRNRFYGDKCENSCSNNCENSLCNDSTGECHSCNNGKYGLRCNISCQTTCRNSTCNQESGDCTYGCHRHEMYGPKCDTQCPETCRDMKCRNNGTCLSCPVGFRGFNCTDRCSEHCMNSTCNQLDGICTYKCSSNFHGDQCDHCIRGRYGEKCEQNCNTLCQNGECEKLTGICTSGCTTDYFTDDYCVNCAKGKWGQQCNNTCNMHCNSSVCEQSSGLCLHGCMGNYIAPNCTDCSLGSYGENCSFVCSPCINGTCNSAGVCNACEDGYFGDYCNISCPEGCLKNSNDNRTCDQKTGICSLGCLDGLHGQTCNSTCDHTCGNKKCDQYTGNCISSCALGFNCDNDLNKNEDDNLALIGGISGALGVVVIVGVIITVLVVLKRRSKGLSNKIQSYENKVSEKSSKRNLPTISSEQSKKGSQKNTSALKVKGNNQIKHNTQDKKARVVNACKTDNKTENIVEEELEELDETNEKETVQTDLVYCNVPQSVSISRLVSYLAGRSFKDYKIEFFNLPQGLIKPYTDAQRPSYAALNRYKGIYPYDHSRVTDEGDQHFYINACFIDGFGKKKAYIASLGPTKNTTQHFARFWQMVWCQKSGKIVMLTNLIENGVSKCDMYWVEFGATARYGEYIVTCTSENDYLEYTTRMLKIKKGNEHREVHQLHFKAWPDKSVPDEVTSLLEFRQRVRDIKTTLVGPTIVHCSAGIGRTGTFIALDRLIEQGEATGKVCVFQTVQEMREQRVSMVQTAIQYEFLHKCLLVGLTSDCSLASPSNLNAQIQKVETVNNTFKVLKENPATHVDDETARDANKKLTDKNRTDSDIPGNKWRPRLYFKRNFGDSDYINAVFADSLTVGNRFILAQTPLPGTVNDFLVLLYQENVSCIISLDPTVTNRKDVGLYQSPDNQRMKQENFTVGSAKVMSTQNYVHRKLRLAPIDKKNEGQRVIHHFQYTSWSETDKVPKDHSKFVQFIQSVESTAQPIPGRLCTLIHCLDGSRRSGLYCAVAILLEHMKETGSVSVLNTLRRIQIRRKTAFPDKEQLSFCYRCLNCLHEDTAVYKNL